MTKRQVMPPLLLVTATLATFGLATWHPSRPAAAPPASVAGDASWGRQVFVVTCAGCHGWDATGGIGPSLHGIGLTATDVEQIVASGRGVMPPGVVKGREAADVSAYVASIAQ